MMPCGGPALSKVDIETIRRWIEGGRPYTNGDPHIQTVDGINYDFQAAGEFVFLRGENLEIQVRQIAVETQNPLGPNPHTGLTSCVSVNGAVALRIGRHRISYQPNLKGQPDPSGLQLRINGDLTNLNASGTILSGGVRITPTTAPGGLQIESRGGTVILITPGWWDQYQIWYLNIDTRHVRATEGLMGAVAPRNWLPAMPDGTLLGPRPEDVQERYNILYFKFGKAWRVTDATTLFDYAAGTSTKTFTIDDWPGGINAQNCKVPPIPGGPAAKPPLKPISLEVAKQLCKDIVDDGRRDIAIQDVMVTGEAGFAKTYLQADLIRRRKRPTAPILEGPADSRKLLDPSVALTWVKSVHPEGDSLTYKLYVWPIDQMPEEKDAIRITEADVKAEARTISKSIPRMEPGKAYYWKVVVEDSKGGSTESETRRIEIKK